MKVAKQFVCQFYVDLNILQNLLDHISHSFLYLTQQGLRQPEPSYSIPRSSHCSGWCIGWHGCIPTTAATSKAITDMWHLQGGHQRHRQGGHQCHRQGSLQRCLPYLPWPSQLLRVGGPDPHRSRPSRHIRKAITSRKTKAIPQKVSCEVPKGELANPVK